MSFPLVKTSDESYLNLGKFSVNGIYTFEIGTSILILKIWLRETYYVYTYIMRVSFATAYKKHAIDDNWIKRTPRTWLHFSPPFASFRLFSLCSETLCGTLCAAARLLFSEPFSNVR